MEGQRTLTPVMLFLFITTLICVVVFVLPTVLFAETDTSQQVFEFVPSSEEDIALEAESTSTSVISIPPASHVAKVTMPSLDTVSVGAIRNISVQFAVFGFLFLLLLVCVAFLTQHSGNYVKKIVYVLMVLVISLPTLFFVISTIYMNAISVTGGPVHWHADFKIYVCGEEIEPPKPPHFLSNKTGTPDLHEHVDKRLHVEGVVIERDDVSLANFFKVQGGELTDISFSIPTASGIKVVKNGDVCQNDLPGTWNVFLYQTDVANNTVTQTKMGTWADYVLSPHELVPPGDCIIFDFGQPHATTEQICDFYAIELEKGKIKLQQP